MLYHEFLREPKICYIMSFHKSQKICYIMSVYKRHKICYEFLQEPQNMLYHEFHDHEGTKYVISLVSAMVTKCVIQ